MWGGYEDWIRYLRNNVKLSMSYLSSDEPALIEVFQRRNVLVHNNGFANQTYFAKVEKSLRPHVKEGDELRLDSAYLDRAIDLIERNFVLIAAELWKKLSPKDEARSSVLTDMTLEALNSERYYLAEATSRFAMEDKQLSERSQLIGRLNFWQSQKWSGKFEPLRAEIESSDFSAKEDLLQLARLVLLDDFEEAIPLIRDLLDRKRLDLASLERWPIFREVRKDPRIAEMIRVRRPDVEKSVKIPGSQLDQSSMVLVDSASAQGEAVSESM